MATPVALNTTFLKSDIITGMDAYPIQRFPAGAGGAGRVVVQTATVNLSATLATTTSVRLVRIPSSAIVKSVKMGIDYQVVTTFTGIVGLLFSDQNDSTTAPNQGQTLQFSSACFVAGASGAGLAMTTTLSGVMLDVTYKADLNVSTYSDGVYVPSASEMPIWLAITQGGPAPQTPGAWAGTGATSLTTSPSYQLSADPGGFFDVYFQPTVTLSATGTVQLTTEVTYITT